MNFSLFVNSRVVSAKIYISDIAVAAAPERERPPALIANLKPRNIEAVNVSEIEKIIIKDRRKSVFILRSFGKSVILLVAVKNSEAAPLNSDIFIYACKGSAELGIKDFIHENI